MQLNVFNWLPSENVAVELPIDYSIKVIFMIEIAKSLINDSMVGHSIDSRHNSLSYRMQMHILFPITMVYNNNS